MKRALLVSLAALCALAPSALLAQNPGGAAPAERLATDSPNAARGWTPAPSKGRLGFAVRWFAPAHVEDGTECPDGFTKGPIEETKRMLAPLAQAERDRLSKPESMNELALLVSKRGPHGEDVCADPFSVQDPGLATVGGKFGYGLNLDGTDDGSETSSTCRHEKFTSPDGDRIDNQFYRLRGCIPIYRNNGMPLINNESMHNGDNTILIEISGVEDLSNDGEVIVGIYSGADPLVTGAAGQVLSSASLTVTDNPDWRVLTKGSIKNGVLQTEPVQLKLKADRSTPPGWYELRGARLRLTLNPDGSAKGILAGYQPISMFEPEVLMSVGVGHSIETRFWPATCPGYYHAVHRLADGYKDPGTGKCTALSSAFDVEAVPAFIIHSSPQQAEAGR